MFLKKENYRHFEKSLFIYEDSAANPETEKFDADKMRKDFEKDFFKDIDIPKDADQDKILDFAKETFAQNFSPEQYETGIREMIGKHVTESSIADRMTNEAVARYKEVYESKMAEFYKKALKKAEDLEDAKDGIQDATKGSLKSLKQDVEKTAKAQNSNPNLEKVTPPAESGDKWPYKIPVLGPIFKDVDLPVLGRLTHSKEERQYAEFQRQNTKVFTEFTKALSGQYLESKQHEDRLTATGKLAYDHLAGRFKDGMEDYTKAQLDYIYENSRDEAALKQNLTNLRDNLVNYYKKYDANGDGIIDLKELGKLEGETKQYVDAIRMVNSGDEGDLEKRFESLSFYNREAWVKSTEILTDRMIRDAAQNGCETQLIAIVKKWGKVKGEINFDTASDKLRGIMRKNAKTGVKETLSAAREFNIAINGERAEILKMEEITPPSIRVLAYDQRELILSRRIIPKSIDDRIVAEFMSTDLVGREKMLGDNVQKIALFQAIQNIKEHYPNIYNSQYRNSIPKEVEKLETRRLHPDQPTKHDEIARIPAMITLAKEAEWVIKNLDNSQDFKGQKLSKQLEGTEAEKVAPKIDLGFRSIDKRYKIGYTSAAERGGFNGRDLGFGIVKIWAGLTLFVNFMNAREKKGGFVGALKAIAANPFAWGATGALAYGADRIQKIPNAKNYLSASPGERDRASTQFSLDGLLKKIPRKAIIDFINSPSEFSAMDELMKTEGGVNTVQQLLKKSRERMQKNKSSVPILTKEDLKGVVKEEVWFKMPEGNPHMRFLFYEKMLTSPKNIRQMKADCEKWI
jgi:hypothetical protein